MGLDIVPALCVAGCTNKLLLALAGLTVAAWSVSVVSDDTTLVEEDFVGDGSRPDGVAIDKDALVERNCRLPGAGGFWSFIVES